MVPTDPSGEWRANEQTSDQAPTVGPGAQVPLIGNLPDGQTASGSPRAGEERNGLGG